MTPAKVVADHLESFLALLDADPDAKGPPAYVQREFYDSLQCGILAHGFLRLGWADLDYMTEVLQSKKVRWMAYSEGYPSAHAPAFQTPPVPRLPPVALQRPYLTPPAAPSRLHGTRATPDTGAFQRVRLQGVCSQRASAEMPFEFPIRTPEGAVAQERVNFLSAYINSCSKARRCSEVRPSLWCASGPFLRAGSPSS